MPGKQQQQNYDDYDIQGEKGGMASEQDMEDVTDEMQIEVLDEETE